LSRVSNWEICLLKFESCWPIQIGTGWCEFRGQCVCNRVRSCLFVSGFVVVCLKVAFVRCVDCLLWGVWDYQLMFVFVADICFWSGYVFLQEILCDCSPNPCVRDFYEACGGFELVRFRCVDG